MSYYTTEDPRAILFGESANADTRIEREIKGAEKVFAPRIDLSVKPTEVLPGVWRYYRKKD